ncbi:MAG: LCP family protein [Suipraeoptans sp.]
MSRRRRYRRGRRKGSWSIGKKVLVALLSILVISIVTVVGIVASKLNKIDQQAINPTELNVSEEAKVRGTGYLNVALFGIDSREGWDTSDTRSDTIMIASLNRETMEVKITSIYRDTLLEQSDGTLNKANSAYASGGPEEAVAMLNKNLDLDIEHYITVDFSALIDVIDAVGGVEIDVQDEEISYINGYATEIIKATGIDSMGVFESGPQVLNGVQATAYSRIRYTAGDDFKRTERQRDVLTKVFQKLQNVNISQINAIVDSVFPKVSTNFTLAEVIDYAKDIFDYNLGETNGFPFDKTTDSIANIGSIVVPVTLDSNVVQLHNFLYGSTEGYVVSDTVSGIRSAIVNKIGNSKADTDESSQQIMNQYDDSYYNTPKDESNNTSNNTSNDNSNDYSNENSEGDYNDSNSETDIQPDSSTEDNSEYTQ